MFRKKKSMDDLVLIEAGQKILNMTSTKFIATYPQFSGALSSVMSGTIIGVAYYSLFDAVGVDFVIQHPFVSWFLTAVGPTIPIFAGLSVYNVGTLANSLQQRDQIFKDLAENVDDVLWTMNLDLKKQQSSLQYVSPSIEKIIGFNPDEVISQGVDGMLTPDSYQKVLQSVGQAIQNYLDGKRSGDEPIDVEIDHYHKDGYMVATETKMKFIQNSQGKIVGMTGVARDMTHRRRIQQERLNSTKLGVAHWFAKRIGDRFRNVMGALSGNMQLVRGYDSGDIHYDGALDDARNICFAEMEDAILKGVNHIEELTAYAQRSPLNKQDRSINEILSAVERDLTKESDLSLSYEIGEDYTIHMDGTYMYEAIRHVIINAHNSMDREGTVYLSVEKCKANSQFVEDHVKISVRDTGKGISEDNLGFIIDDFRVDTPESWGKGIDFSKAVLAMHDGYIGVESKVGAGSTFHLYLPLNGKDK